MEERKEKAGEEIGRRRGDREEEKRENGGEKI